MNPTRQHTLTEQDHAVIKSFALPIQLNIPLADNPKNVTLVLLMLTCGMIEHTYFGTPNPTNDFTFESDEAGYGLKLFEGVMAFSDVEKAAIAYLRYLRTGETYGLDGINPEDLDHDNLTRQEILAKRPKIGVLSQLLYKFSRWLDRNFGPPNM